MATIMLSLEGVSVRRSSGKPRILLRGQRRKTAQKLQQALKVMSNQEWNESVRSSANSYSPFLVLGDASSKYSKALALLMLRLDESLKAKA